MFAANFFNIDILTKECLIPEKKFNFCRFSIFKSTIAWPQESQVYSKACRAFGPFLPQHTWTWKCKSQHNQF